MRFFSIGSIASALSLSSASMFLRNVLILLRVEKHLSASHEVIGIVFNTFKRSTVSEKVSESLLSIIN